MTRFLSSRTALVLGCLSGLLFAATPAFAQYSDPIPADPAAPLDDITTRSVLKEHKVLKYAPIREADILWEKRLWRVIDTREKMNLPFIAPESSLFTALSDAIGNGDLTAYADDGFSMPMKKDDAMHLLSRTDTVIVRNMETEQDEVKVVTNSINWEDVKRFRIKESWYFDTNTGTLRVRILGIAPLLNVNDESDNFRYEQPLFWIHYPTARPLLASHKAIMHGGNYASTMSWEDLFEMRYFASHILKENNLQDLRLQDYLAGEDLLLASERIEDDLFNREHDLWSW